MRVGAPKETFKGEKRVAMTPSSALQIQKLGHSCFIETGAGEQANFTDSDYQEAGVTIIESATKLWQEVDIITKVQAPTDSEVKKLGSNKTLISFINPTQNQHLLDAGKDSDSSIIAMDMIPRISRAQKMDALSSMSNISGYRAVMEAGNHFGRFFTGQITAAGKVPPAKVLVIGVGVAGLAAIGAAQSLGAVVKAFDVRPEVSEQIESMGAEFLFLDFDDSASAADVNKNDGYASPSSPEFREKQLECFRAQAPEIDIVIATALIPGRDAPKLWLTDMVEAMKPGSVIVDLAAERGGNCDLTIPDEKVVTDNGVTIIGYTDFTSRMATQSSELYATNIRHLLSDLTPENDGVIVHDMEDDVIRGATVAHAGQITFPPPPPKVQAIASHAVEKAPVKTAEEIASEEALKRKKTGQNQISLLAVGGLLTLLIGNYAPASFMQHFIVFVLACFIGFQVIWNVNHALHTPLMSITNAISGIIVLGAILQFDSGGAIVLVLAGISVLIASINIVGGFMVTRRMLQMFQKS